ncbi:helix-turn-helix domain-containing protein [Paenibacillus sp. GM2]|uniref:helix-turn-helix domain-containing protein n=1 Tax=Paenibacillus sp. GM2 TaxID=1622070 RepID=UPI00083955F7|nr:helix-turn-helix domain-containing protein [Paenibacillus sp. GM2]
MEKMRIRRIRKSKNLSGTKIAKQMGISAQHYYDIEKGENGLSAENALKLAEIFDVSLDYLLGVSIVAVIENRINELNMSMDDLNKAMEWPKGRAESLDSFPPDPSDYEPGGLIDRLAKALDMDSSILAAAYGRQEPPAYDGPSISPQEAFNQLQKDFENEDFDEVTQPASGASDELSEKQILTLAAHQVGHEGALTEEQLAQIKLAMKIALAKNDK